MNDTKMYRASIHFYSDAEGEVVTVMTDVSDELTEDQSIPASYSQMQVTAMTLRSRAIPVTIDEDAQALLNDPSLAPEEVAAAMLARVTAADLIAAEISQ